jgi:hypothetical protein
MRFHLHHAGIVALVVGGAAMGCSSTDTPTAEAIGSSAAAISTPTDNFQFQFQLGAPRPVVAVGRDWVLETDTGGVQGFKRNVDAHGSFNGAATAALNLSLQSIFDTPNPGDAMSQDASYNAELANLQTEFPSGVQQYVAPCTATNTANCASAWYDGDTVYDEYSGHFFIMTKVRRSVWSCADVGISPPPNFTAGWNDGHRTNGVIDHPCFGAPEKYVEIAAHRSIMVAVSQCNAQLQDCENPTRPFLTYTLAEDDADWAQIDVSRGLVMVNYRVNDGSNYKYPNDVAAGKVYGYSAQSLISGTLKPSTSPTPGFLLTASNFATTGVSSSGAQVSTGEASNQNFMMFAAMHQATSTDWPTLVTMHDGNNVWAYDLVPTSTAYLQAAANAPSALNLWDLSPWISSIQPSTPAVVTVPGGMNQQFNTRPVWSTASSTTLPGALYWSFRDTASGGISAFQWPMRSWSPSAPPQFGASATEWDSNRGFTQNEYDFPVLEHNYMSGDNVLVYHQDTPPGDPTNVTVTPFYTVAEPNDLVFATSVAIPPAPPAFTPGFAPVSQPANVAALASAGGAVDILSDVSDPIRPQVFFTSVASSGGGYTPFVTAITMPDGVVNSPFFTPEPLQIPLGSNQTVEVDFTGGALGLANVSVPLPTCTAGGDLGAPTNVKVSPQSVTLSLSLPSTATVGATYIEGISCTNGVSVVVPVTATAAAFYPYPSTIQTGTNSGCTSVPLVWNGLVNCGNATYAVTMSPPSNLYEEIVASGIAYGGGFAWETLEICTGTGGVATAPNDYTVTIDATCGGSTYVGSLTVDVAVPGCQPSTCGNSCAASVPDGCGHELDCLNNCTGGSTCTAPEGSTVGTLCCPPGQYIPSTGGACICPSGSTWNATDQECLVVGPPGGGGGGHGGCRGTTCM